MHSETRVFWSLCIVLPLVFGCTGEEPTTLPAARTNPSSFEQNSPCFNNACASLQELLTVPDAENMIFSADGRLFVSGGQSVIEVLKNGDDFAAQTISSGVCNFTGLAIARNTLYANCGDGTLWAGALNQTPVTISPVFNYEGMALANGLTSSADGQTLYAVDGPIATSSLPSPKIVKLKIAASNPLQIENQTTWLDLAGRFPNGIQRRGNLLYFTDSEIPNLGRLNVVPIQNDGSAGMPLVLATLQSLPDDFSILPDGFAVTYFLTGQVIKLNFLGEQTDGFNPLTFSTGTSQVMQGRPPLFSSTDLLVTEKGILGEQSSPIGNKLTLVRKTNIN
ncbi:MAG: hypothetical protein CMN90_10860 [Sutterellaceae bacterium]|jgi:hypothetical protein|nr:hypothetical protein [Sutterellaceae bacterium]MBU0792008.1 hypothetical protein [Gammaproteobacteria bacterium]|tara:strand:+ start:6968 stop:7975 length:1008 start_codon:yes stop_codon:yes gene_type:complete